MNFRAVPRAWLVGPTTKVGPEQHEGDFSAIKTNFREPGDASPCATSCTVVLHISHCTTRLFRDRRDSVSLSPITVSHCPDSSAVLDQKVTQECAMWRIKFCSNNCVSGRLFPN